MLNKITRKLVAMILFSPLVFLFESCESSSSSKTNVNISSSGDTTISILTDVKGTCTKPHKSYAKNIDAAVNAKFESLENLPKSDIEANLKSSVVQLATYSTQGLDRDLLMFRICEMSLKLGFTQTATQKLIERAMDSWDKELEKKK